MAVRENVALGVSALGSMTAGAASQIDSAPFAFVAGVSHAGIVAIAARKAIPRPGCAARVLDFPRSGFEPSRPPDQTAFGPSAFSTRSRIKNPSDPGRRIETGQVQALHPCKSRGELINDMDCYRQSASD
jgi:hypothetical protein